jgi:hypothetical protein
VQFGRRPRPFVRYDRFCVWRHVCAQALRCRQGNAKGYETRRPHHNGNWIPNDPTFVSQVLKISSAFTPPPPEGFISPMTWGVESHIIERFGQAGVPKKKISMVKDTYYFASPDKSPTQFIELFETFYGPTMNAVEAAQKNGKARELHAQLVELANAQNKSKDAGTLILATFMRVSVSVLRQEDFNISIDDRLVAGFGRVHLAGEIKVAPTRVRQVYQRRPPSSVPAVTGRKVLKGAAGCICTDLTLTVGDYY